MKVAVCIVTFNAANFLRKCITSVLNQTYDKFRLIIVDDGSTDNTEEIIKEFNDARIYYKRNSKNLGIAAARNESIRQLKDEKYVFFIDADCYAVPHWIENGLDCFKNKEGVICVNGQTIYVCEGYHPHLSEKSHIQTDSWREAYQTCNIAYRRKVFQAIKGFDEKNFNYLLEDIDFAIRVKKQFSDMKFIHSEKMKVVHQKIEFTISSFFSDTLKVLFFMKLLKKYGKTNPSIPSIFKSNILNKDYFFLSIFPLGIIFYIIKTQKRVSCARDLLFVFLYILKSYYYRILTWNYAVKMKVRIF